eukprot:461567-Pleurochrysis_carterae.AAC.1
MRTRAGRGGTVLAGDVAGSAGGWGCDAGGWGCTVDDWGCTVGAALALSASARAESLRTNCRTELELSSVGCCRPAALDEAETPGCSDAAALPKCSPSSALAAGGDGGGDEASRLTFDDELLRDSSSAIIAATRCLRGETTAERLPWEKERAQKETGASRAGSEWVGAGTEDVPRLARTAAFLKLSFLLDVMVREKDEFEKEVKFGFSRDAI